MRAEVRKRYRFAPGELLRLVMKACEEHRSLCLYENDNPKSAQSNQERVRELIAAEGLEAVATMRRVGPYWRTYVTPLDEEIG